MTLTLNTPDTDATHQLLPLSQLTLSPLNARQEVDPAEVAAMSDSIATLGLLQNLIGLQYPGTSMVEIVAGGKRLRALQLLAKHGFLPRADTALSLLAIPVRVTDNPDTALEWAGAENTARSQPHPADEVRHYRALQQRGHAPRTIALALAQTEAHVNRRLRLASLPDTILDALRSDDITLDQAKAFTVARNDMQATDMLAGLLAAGSSTWGWAARDIRQKLTADRPGARDKRLAYIGLPAYTAAGGSLTLDLFEDSSYVDNPDLLQTLANDKLTARAAELQAAEGWSWSQVAADQWELRSTCDFIPATPGELTEADAEAYDRLTELAEAGVIDAAGQAELDALEARAEGDWTDEDRARCGIAIYLLPAGIEGIARGLLNREAARSAAAADGDDTADDEATTTAPAPEAGMPQNLRDDLRAIRLLSLQHALLDDPTLLEDLAMWQLSGGDLIAWEMPLAISLDRAPNTPANTDGLTMPSRLNPPAPAGSRMEPTPQAFTAYRNGNTHERFSAYAAALARAYRQPTGLLSVFLAQMVSPQPRNLWTPNARNFFGRVPVAMLDAIWAELVPIEGRDDKHAAFAAMTKRDKAAHLDKLFNNADYTEALGLSRAENQRIATWLPEDLRWPDAPSAT